MQRTFKTSNARVLSVVSDLMTPPRQQLHLDVCESDKCNLIRAKL